jgi:hypothetical protein
VAGNRLVEHIASSLDTAVLNRDDRNLLEYGFARSLGTKDLFSVSQLREQAVALGDHRPPLPLSKSSWEEVDAHRLIAGAVFDGHVRLPAHPSRRLCEIARILDLYWQGDTAALLTQWRRQNRKLLPPTELAIGCLAMAFEGDTRLEQFVQDLARLHPLEAEGVLALYAVRMRDYDRAAAALQNVFVGLRKDPWMFRHVAELLFDLAAQVATADDRLAVPLYEALEESFAGKLLEDERKIARVVIARTLNPRRIDLLVPALEALEPHTPWNATFLHTRVQAYRTAGHPLTARAERELAKFFRHRGEHTRHSFFTAR